VFFIVCLAVTFLVPIQRLGGPISTVFSCGYASSPCGDSVLSCGELLRAVSFFCRLGEKSQPICRDVRKSFC